MKAFFIFLSIFFLIGCGSSSDMDLPGHFEPAPVLDKAPSGADKGKTAHSDQLSTSQSAESAVHTNHPSITEGGKSFTQLNQPPTTGTGKSTAQSNEPSTFSAGQSGAYSDRTHFPEVQPSSPTVGETVVEQVTTELRPLNLALLTGNQQAVLSKSCEVFRGAKRCFDGADSMTGAGYCAATWNGKAKKARLKLIEHGVITEEEYHAQRSVYNAERAVCKIKKEQAPWYKAYGVYYRCFRPVALTYANLIVDYFYCDRM